MKETIITKMTTREFAELILASPEIVYSFVTNLADSEANVCSWYGITNARMFDVQNVFINRLAIIGGAPFMFDLSYYNENIDIEIGEKQSEECTQEMINGLNHFNQLYGGASNAWYIKKDDYDKLRVMYG